MSRRVQLSINKRKKRITETFTVVEHKLIDLFTKLYILYNTLQLQTFYIFTFLEVYFFFHITFYFYIGNILLGVG